MTISERERLHFARVAEAKRAEHELRAKEAIATPAIARIIEGLAMGDAVAMRPETEAMLDERARGQAELHAQARRLGMIR